MADATGAAGEQHRNWGNRREHGGVVAGAALEANDGSARRCDRLRNELREAGRTVDGRSPRPDLPLEPQSPEVRDRAGAVTQARKDRLPHRVSAMADIE